MISKGLREMVKGRWREFKREPSAMFFVVLMPVVWMVILGLAFSRPKIEHFEIALVEPQPDEKSAEWEQTARLLAASPPDHP